MARKLGYGVGNTNGARSFAGKTAAVPAALKKFEGFLRNVGRLMK